MSTIRWLCKYGLRWWRRLQKCQISENALGSNKLLMQCWVHHCATKVQCRQRIKATKQTGKAQRLPRGSLKLPDSPPKSSCTGKVAHRNFELTEYFIRRREYFICTSSDRRFPINLAWGNATIKYVDLHMKSSKRKTSVCVWNRPMSGSDHPHHIVRPVARTNRLSLHLHGNHSRTRSYMCIYCMYVCWRTSRLLYVCCFSLDRWWFHIMHWGCSLI